MKIGDIITVLVIEGNYPGYGWDSVIQVETRAEGRKHIAQLQKVSPEIEYRLQAYRERVLYVSEDTLHTEEASA